VCGPDGYCVANTPPDCNDGDSNTRDVCALDGSGAPQCQHQCLNDQPCADTDLCTDDHCQGSEGCVHLPKTRYDGVTCRLETMGQLLAAAGPDEVADKVRTKLEGLLARAGANLEAARAAGTGKRAKRKLGTTAKLLKGVVKTVDTALRKHRIAPALADALRQAAMGAGAVVNDLKANLTP